jgi:hypothetical protein
MPRKSAEESGGERTGRKEEAVQDAPEQHGSRAGEKSLRPDRPTNSQGKQPLSGGSYVLVSLAMVVAATVMALYLLTYTKGGPASEALRLAYYGIILILGLAAASFLFGAMRSYARYRGKTTLGSLELGGPVVVSALVMSGFYYLESFQKDFSLRLVLTDVSRVPTDGDLKFYFREGSVRVSVDQFQNIYPIDENGYVYLWKIPYDYQGQKAQLEIFVPGYELAGQPKSVPNNSGSSSITTKRELVLSPGVDETILLKPVEFRITGQISEELGKIAGEFNLPEDEAHNFYSLLARAMTLVHPGWTTWRYERRQIESQFTVFNQEDPAHNCRMRREVKWHLSSPQDSLDLFADGCQDKDDFHWKLELWPEKSAPDTSRPEKSGNIASITPPSGQVLNPTLQGSPHRA